MKRNFASEIGVIQENHQHAIKGRNGLNKVDQEYLEQQKQKFLNQGLEKALELDAEFDQVQEAKLKTRKPLSSSPSIEQKTLGFQQSQFAIDILNHRQPKNYLLNKIDEAIMLDNRDFLSELYDRLSEQKPADKKELDFNSAVTGKIRTHFETKTNLKDLEIRTQELRTQRAAAQQFLDAIDYGKPINTISSYKTAFSGGQYR